MGTVQVYVALIDEAVDVWRPVQARAVGDDVFELLGIVPPEESWQFQPGARVRCDMRAFANGERGLVAYEQVAL
jgi:hypothetical protein